MKMKAERMSLISQVHINPVIDSYGIETGDSNDFSKINLILVEMTIGCKQQRKIDILFQRQDTEFVSFLLPLNNYLLPLVLSLFQKTKK